MQIAINIPKEFERDWNETRFADCIQRVMCDLRDYPNHDKMTGNYEMETLEMLQNAFENGKQLPKGHDMERVEQLEEENKRLRDGIAKAKAKVERKCIGGQFSEAVIYGMQKAMEIFDECLGEVEHENEK